MNNNDYTKELHATSRHYDTKLWAVPGIAFGITLTGLGLNLNHLNEPRIYFLFAVINFLLWMQFTKDHVLQILVQNELRKLDESKPALYSPTKTELKEYLKDLLKGDKNFYLRKIDYLVASISVSTCVSFIMLLMAVTSATVGIIFLLNLRYIFCSLENLVIIFILEFILLLVIYSLRTK